MYWNMCQQLAHHTVNGCNLRVGDLCKWHHLAHRRQLWVDAGIILRGNQAYSSEQRTGAQVFT